MRGGARNENAAVPRAPLGARQENGERAGGRTCARWTQGQGDWNGRGIGMGREAVGRRGRATRRAGARGGDSAGQMRWARGERGGTRSGWPCAGVVTEEEAVELEGGREDERRSLRGGRGERWRRAMRAQCANAHNAMGTAQRTAARGQRGAAMGLAGAPTQGMEAPGQGAAAGEAGTMRWAQCVCMTLEGSLVP